MNNETKVISRAFLYNFIAEHLDSLEDKLTLKQNKEYIYNVFKDSARFAGVFEGEIDKVL